MAFNQLKAQNPNSSTNANANALANKIAKKMQDTLGLNASQRNQIKDVNLQLHNEKMAARAQYINRDSVAIRLQQIENKRDALYRPILTEQQFGMYRQKKRNLVSAN